jgi:tetratricopeptide (TPR) repeat protein
MSRIPEDVDERAALYRSVLSGRRVLVVLDNAAGPRQVRPLLPGSRSCLTLVTSRSRLSALVAQSAAATLRIDVLSAAESMELITNVLGPNAVAAQAAAAAYLAQLCAYLPLALRIAAAHVAMGTYGSIAELAEELARGNRLATLECDDDPKLAVRSAFELSYRNLGPPLRLAFRRLGLIEGPDFTPRMLAVIVGTSMDEARRLIRTLSHAHLIEPKPYGRWRLHDLLAEFARDRVHEEETPELRGSTVDALLSWYVSNAEAYGPCLRPSRPRLSERAAREADASEYAAALEWFESERPGLVATAHQAWRLRAGAPVWELADAAYDFLRLRRYYHDNVGLQQLGLAAAGAGQNARAKAYALRHLADIHRELGRYEEALRFAKDAAGACRLAGPDTIRALHMLRMLGQIHVAMGQYAKALDCLEEDLRISRELGDRAGEAATLRPIGRVHLSMGQYTAAIDYLRQAADLGREVGSRRDEGAALQQLAYACWTTGSHYPQALEHARRALKVWRDSGDQDGEAWTLDLLTIIMRSRGEHQEGAEYARQALALRQTIGDRQGEAQALDTLSRLHRMLGEYHEAERYAMDALALRREIGDRQGEAESLETVARAVNFTGDHRRSFDCATNSLRIRREIGDRQGEARILYLLASFAAHMERLTDAFELAQESLAIYRQIGDRKGEGMAFHHMARTCRKLDQLSDAIVHARRSLEVRRDLGDRHGAAEALDNISRTYLKMGNLHAALNHAKQALAVEREIADLFGQGWTLDHLANIQLALGRPAQAARSAERSLKIREQIQDLYGQCRTLDTLTRINLVRERPEQALDAARRALNIVRSTAKPDELTRRLREVAHLTEQTESVEAATGYWQEAADLDD